MPIIDGPDNDPMAKSLTTKVPKILGIGTEAAPKAIVLVTAHWMTRRPTISNGQKHKLYYDYGGFPAAAYKLKYDAPGSPEIAGKIYEALEKIGLSPEMDNKRGWDHGVFVPMLLINPKADIPVIQLSVMQSGSPAAHFAIGQALAPLRDEGVAIVASGMASWHNMRIMFKEEPSMQKRNKQWSQKLTETVAIEDAEVRGKALDGWREWVGAKEAHPEYGVEHFLPLIVCAGAGGNEKSEAFSDKMWGSDYYTYYWGSH